MNLRDEPWRGQQGACVGRASQDYSTRFYGRHKHLVDRRWPDCFEGTSLGRLREQITDRPWDNLRGQFGRIDRFVSALGMAGKIVARTQHGLCMDCAAG